MQNFSFYLVLIKKFLFLYSFKFFLDCDQLKVAKCTSCSRKHLWWHAFVTGMCPVSTVVPECTSFRIFWLGCLCFK